MIKSALEFMGTNAIVLGLSSFCGIVGFLLTVIVAIRTDKISRILKHNALTSQYNKERKAYQNIFEGHRASITEDGIRSDKLLKDILKSVEEYRVKFDILFSWLEKIMIYFFIKELKKEARIANWNKICNYLAIFSGRLSKKEEKKNG